jgi:MFS family permease
MASLSPALVVTLAIPMHGVSYTFFSVVAAIFVDREAPMELRASAQALVAFVAAGVGPWTGNLLAAACVESQRFGSVVQWQAVWLIPTLGSTLLLGVFVAFFHLKTSQSK